MKKREIFILSCKIFSVLMALVALVFFFVKGDFPEGQETLGKVLACILCACILAIIYLLEKSEREWKKWRKKRDEDQHL